MSHPLEGITRFILLSTVSTGAGATTVDVHPDKGCVWEILYCFGWQNDGSIVCAWKMEDPDTAENTLHSATVAVNVHYHLGTEGNGAVTDQCYLRGPLIVTVDRWVKYIFTASAASKTGTVVAIVREYRGVESEA